MCTQKNYSNDNQAIVVCRKFCCSNLCVFSAYSQMMWRLNFLVFWVCIFLGNTWMLYYICPMHTLFTVFVYITLAVNNKMNQESNSFVLLKIFGITLVTIMMWEVPGKKRKMERNIRCLCH